MFLDFTEVTAPAVSLSFCPVLRRVSSSRKERGKLHPDISRIDLTLYILTYILNYFEKNKETFKCNLSQPLTLCKYCTTSK